MNNILANWKTSSAGILTIATAIVHVIFEKPMTEASVLAALTSVMTGLGLICAGDASKGNGQGGQSGPATKGTVTALLLWLALGSMVLMWAGSGCAHLQPGANPIVVRVEQAETSAKASFVMALNTDNMDRGFWRTNAPAFHGFCEWLRVPTPYGTNTLPRYRALLLSLDDVKLDYKAARASSNQLYTALVTFESVATQAGSWLNILTNKTGVGQ